MSRLLVSYEWEWASFDAHGDIDAVDYADPGDLLGTLPGMTLHALVKNYGNEEEGLKDRAWAYVEDGALPAVFSDGTKVPANLAAEFARVAGGAA